VSDKSMAAQAREFGKLTLTFLRKVSNKSMAAQAREFGKLTLTI